MGLMDTIRRINENKKASSEKFKQMQEEYKLNKILEDRQKSSNERELENYYKKQRESEIKEALDKIHKQQNKDSWKGTISLKQKDMLKDDRPILKEKNIFANQKSVLVDNKNKVPLQNKRQGMFFRW